MEPASLRPCVPALTGDPIDELAIPVIKYLQGLKVLALDGTSAFIGSYLNNNPNDLMSKICTKQIESTATRATFYVGARNSDSGIRGITVEKSAQGWAVMQYS